MRKAKHGKKSCAIGTLASFESVTQIRFGLGYWRMALCAAQDEGLTGRAAFLFLHGPGIAFLHLKMILQANSRFQTSFTANSQDLRTRLQA